MIERNISRRDLYALGEPLGDGATYRKPCGGLVCGIGGSSKSSTSSTTNNQDNRTAVQGGAGLSNSSGNVLDMSDNRRLDLSNRSTNNWDTSNRSTNNWDTSNRSTNNWDTSNRSTNNTSTTINTTNTDAGSIKAAFDFSGATAGRALETVELSNATLSQGYQSLIDAAGSLFDRGESLIGQTQKSVADAYGQAQTDKAGGIDQKTIIVLAIAGAVGLWAMKKA